ncbi:unnamed protein product [Didymodactylos carnosus]|uniref:Phosphoglycerate mutase n=1 Tax=Didymodactylos carnosus TaxID=1234261 RepID=A0A815VAM3_9BILA|nr:unnamed protein product [Didymodactylos carnosus]CAF1568582.1 unnamed protein product [Didymodactylos carnosus]CAF4362201.1 unnamed protein product [Didymodactylos carnosus]CAF4386720.1 unnamed protein product [Didymodactylos carnosus]
MLHLFLIRHGESDMNVQFESTIGGRGSLTPLTDRGRLQAEQLGKHLAREAATFTAMFTSTAKRTQETAGIALSQMKAYDKGLQIIENIEELSQGEWEGKNRQETYTDEITALIEKDNYNFAAPGGESQAQVEKRMLDFINDHILLQFDPKQSLKFGIFGHGFAFKCILRHILNSDPSMTWKIQLDNTSITEIAYSVRGWHIIRVNDISHLKI